jgi:phosphoribosylanthranilate isomerase
VTRAKICGITRHEDAELAAELGAWAIGLIRWERSPRACDPATAAAIVAAQRRRVACVGVFVNATLEELAREAEQIPYSHLQLHGDEGPAFCREAARRTGCKIIKAARVRDAAQVQALRPFRTDYHLLDAHSSVAPGGTGQRFDWTLVRHHGATPPIVLSGGLTPDTVAEAVAATRPFAVDTASGTEAEPGRKDPAKLAAFVSAVAGADAPHGAPV